MILTLTAKNHEALRSNMVKRLSPDLINLYSSNSEDPTSKGMQILTDLRTSEHKLEQTGGLIKSLQASSGPEATGDHLLMTPDTD